MNKRKQRRKRRRKIGLIFLLGVLIFLILPNKKQEVSVKKRKKFLWESFIVKLGFC